jgi:hypothetical protein
MEERTMLLFATDFTTYAMFGAAMLIGVAIIYSVIVTLVSKGKPDPTIEELEREAQNDIIIDETHGTIVHMECGTVAGGKTSRTYKQFYIVFRDDFGNEKDFYISEDIYLELDTNIPGTLATVEGNFYGFCYDESASVENEEETE